MPHLRIDPESYDEIASELGSDVDMERPTGDWQYDPAEATFNRKKLGPVARAMLDALLAAGATSFGVRYDGGYRLNFRSP
jgi:hypothetical protein